MGRAGAFVVTFWIPIKFATKKSLDRHLLELQNGRFSKNNGTPQIIPCLIGFSIYYFHHPFWSTIIFGNTQIKLLSFHLSSKSICAFREAGSNGNDVGRHCWLQTMLPWLKRFVWHQKRIQQKRISRGHL